MYHAKLFLVSQVSSTADTDVNYWVFPLTPKNAQDWLNAMDRVKQLALEHKFLLVGLSVYGVEVFCPSRWLCASGELDNRIPPDVLDNARVVVLPGEPEDWNLTESDERFECETAVIGADGVTFKANLKYANRPEVIESDYIMRAAFEMAARGEVDEESEHAKIQDHDDPAR